jgi:hypothetical protein
MRELLEALADWPNVDTRPLRDRPEWEQARTWGWVMESGELTGTGLAHVKELPGGIVHEQAAQYVPLCMCGLVGTRLLLGEHHEDHFHL